MGRVALAYERNAAFWAGRLTERLALAVGDGVIEPVHELDAHLDLDPEQLTDSMADRHGLIAVTSRLGGDERSAADPSLHLAISLAIRATVPVLVVELHGTGPADRAPDAPDGAHELGITRLSFDIDDFDAEADRCAEVIHKWVGAVARAAAPLQLIDGTVPAFVGLTARTHGDIVRISTWRQFVDVFGEPAAGMLLPAAVFGWFANGGRACYVASAARPSDPDVPLSVDDLIGSAEPPSGLLGLGVVDEITVIALPDLATACTGIGSDTIDLDAWKRAELTAIAEAERDQRMVILDPPPGLTPQQVRSWRTEVAGYDSRHAVLYYPWAVVDDPMTGRSITVPPSGHVAGVWASVERERGVWFAPANRTLVGVARGERRLTRGERFFLEPVGINPMRGLQERDVRPWGSRTMSSDPSWSRVEVVRTVFAIARGCERGLEWAAFEPNTTATRSFVRRRVEAFLRRLWHDGALVGGEPSEAFVVQCDEQVSPPDAPVRVLVGVAPHTAGDLLWFSVGGSG